MMDEPPGEPALIAKNQIVPCEISALERVANGLHHELQRLRKGLANFGIGDNDRARHPFEQVTPFHFHGQPPFERRC